MTWPLILRSLFRHPVRTAMVVLGISVAAALLLDMVMLAGGIERSFSRMLLSRGFQIRLSPKGTLPFDTEATIPDVTPLLDRLHQDPDIAAAGPVVAASVYARVGDSLVTLVGYGIDPAGQGLYQVESGTDLTPNDTSGLLVSAPVTARTGWVVGDSVTLLGRLDPQSARAAAERRLVIRGRVRWLYDARGQRSIGTNFRVIQRLGRFPSPDPASMVMVKVKDDAKIDSVAARLGSFHRSIEVNSVAALVRQFRTRLAYFQQLSLILATISLVVGVLLVGTILTITVNERTGEFAVLRAIGFRRSRIVALVMIEGALLTILGAAIGTVTGLVTARYLDRILTSFPGLPAAISFFVPTADTVSRAGIVVLIAGIGAAAYPAYLAGRAPIAETLRADAE